MRSHVFRGRREEVVGKPLADTLLGSPYLPDGETDVIYVTAFVGHWVFRFAAHHGRFVLKRISFHI